MRILLITSIYPGARRPTKGTFNRTMVAGLTSAGDDVRVITPVPWTDLILARHTGGIGDAAAYPVWWYPPRLALAARHHWMRRSVRAAAARVTTDWQPDLVVGYWAHPDGTVAVETARQLEVPAVLMVGGSDIRLHTSDDRRRQVIIDTLQRADRVLTIGDRLREAVIDLGVPAQQVRAIHRGVDTRRFRPGAALEARATLGLPNDRPIILWVGRMVPVKGLDLLIDAWRDVHDHPARPLLVLAGDGELRHGLERRARDLASSIRFAGVLAHDTLPAWYRAADAVVLSSTSEGVPNVLLEGLACGTPFIATDVGGVRELTHQHGVLVPVGDRQRLGEALLKRFDRPLLSDRETLAVLDDRAATAVLQDELHAIAARPQRNGTAA